MRRVLEGGERFKYASVAERYGLRPDYSDEVVARLLALVRDEPRAVLDAGCGDGRLARRLAPRVDRVDAVDFSEEMLRRGRELPGDPERLRWILGAIESAPLEPPYALIVAGASFHWFDAARALGRFAECLTPSGRFALVDGDAPEAPPWHSAEEALMRNTVTELTGRPPDWKTAHVVERPLLDHPRFHREGVHITTPVLVEQSIEDYVACQHSRQTWCLEAMGGPAARSFDARLRQLLGKHARGGRLRYRVRTRLEWGRPLAR